MLHQCVRIRIGIFRIRGGLVGVVTRVLGAFFGGFLRGIVGIILRFLRSVVGNLVRARYVVRIGVLVGRLVITSLGVVITLRGITHGLSIRGILVAIFIIGGRLIIRLNQGSTALLRVHSCVSSLVGSHRGLDCREKRLRCPNIILNQGLLVALALVVSGVLRLHGLILGSISAIAVLGSLVLPVLLQKTCLGPGASVGGVRSHCLLDHTQQGLAVPTHQHLVTALQLRCILSQRRTTICLVQRGIAGVICWRHRLFHGGDRRRRSSRSEDDSSNGNAHGYVGKQKRVCENRFRRVLSPTKR
mmetsp:Transcript_126830/g.290148  ORF Transcript_126830/g.290148 Transcript_126830/m.290148 type:complete len:302 (-) Transcript_126830:1-906(-)